MRLFLVGLASLGLFTTPAVANEAHNPMPFSKWLERFKADARSEGISSSLLDEAFRDIEPDSEVIRLDRKQPEGTMSYEEYYKKVISYTRVRNGRNLYAEHKDMLEPIAKEYGVHAEVIIALWGIETSYGDYTGNFNIIESLATLAYDGRRSGYFRKELINALKILEQGDTTASEISGSWAGALGQCQFMPSTYLDYAVDHNKDGKRDVWYTQEDVFASMANYLSGLGWNPDEPLAFPVDLPEGFDNSLAVIDSTKPLSEWKKLGVTRSDGKAWPDNDTHVSLIFVGRKNSPPSYIVYDNYKRLLRWNRSRYFATSVSILAGKIKEQN